MYNPIRARACLGWFKRLSHRTWTAVCQNLFVEVSFEYVDLNTRDQAQSEQGVYFKRSQNKLRPMWVRGICSRLELVARVVLYV